MEAHAYLKFPDDESDPFSEVPGESHDMVWWNFTLWKVEGKQISEELFQIYTYIYGHIPIYIHLVYVLAYTMRVICLGL